MVVVAIIGLLSALAIPNFNAAAGPVDASKSTTALMAGLTNTERKTIMQNIVGYWTRLIFLAGRYGNSWRAF